MSTEKFKTEDDKNKDVPENPVTPSAQIEQFYEKPETGEEMVENMKALKEIPEDPNEPKVVIKLGNPEKSHKFVLMEDEDGRQYFVALPIDKKKWHADIANFARKLYKKDLRVIGGGYVRAKGNKLTIEGASQSYGEAPKEVVKEILQKKFPGMEIEAITLTEREEMERQSKYKEALDGLETTVQKELYAAVLDREAVKLGLDYTSIPKNIEDNKDFAYMIYSSENGSNFGFDTAYLGYKSKNGEIKTKGVIRNRWRLKINEIKIEDDGILIKYISGDEGKEKTIKVPLKGIEDFKMISNLDEVEKQLVKMYDANRSIYQNMRVCHGTH